MSLSLVISAAKAASTKTLDDTVVLDVGDLIGITDHFVITGGRNDRQVRAIVDEVARAVKAGGGTLYRREGLADARWVLLDYGDFIVHVLDAEAREYYSLERLWSDSTRVEWSDDDDLSEAVAPRA